MNLSDSRIHKCALSIFAVCFVVFSFAWITVPGLYYDECIFINAALGETSGPFIHKVMFGIPTMIMAYIGALKSYFYAPVFYLFGVSPATVRTPVIVLTACTLIISFFLARRLFGAMLATLFVGILATDPALIYNVRLDYGPVALMMFFKVSALFFFFRMIETKYSRYAWMLAASLLLGIYDKLNFVWFVSAFGVAAVLFYAGDIRKAFVANKKGFLAPLVAFLGLFLVLIIELIIPALTYNTGSPQSIGFVERVISLGTIYKMTMNGSWTFAFVMAGGEVPATLSNYLLLPMGLGLVVVLLGIFKKSIKMSATKTGRHLWFFSVIFILVSVQIVVTRQAGGAHHMMMLYPFHYLILFSLVQAVQPMVASRYSKLALGAFCAIYLTVLSSNVCADVRYSSAFQSGNGIVPKWNPAIYRLSDLLEKYPCDAVVCVDWGLQIPLSALAAPEDRNKYLEGSGIFKRMNPNDPANLDFVYQRFFADRNVIVVLYADDAEIMPTVNQNFLRIYDTYLRPATMVQKIYSQDGRLIYQVYYVSSRAQR
jgi:hypothetical protein